jgi:hypothetical protein
MTETETASIWTPLPRVEFDPAAPLTFGPVTVFRLGPEQTEAIEPLVKLYYSGITAAEVCRWGVRGSSEEGAKPSHVLQRFLVCMLLLRDSDNGRWLLFSDQPAQEPLSKRILAYQPEILYPLSNYSTQSWSADDCVQLAGLWEVMLPFLLRESSGAPDRGRLARAFNGFWASYLSYLDPPRLPVVVAAIETLIGTDTRNTARNFATRIALCLSDGQDADELCREAVEVYDYRSKLVHGDTYVSYTPEERTRSLRTATRWFRQLAQKFAAQGQLEIVDDFDRAKAHLEALVASRPGINRTFAEHQKVVKQKHGPHG